MEFQLLTLRTALIVWWRTCELHEMKAYCQYFVHYIFYVLITKYRNIQFSPAFDDTMSLALAGRDNFLSLHWFEKMDVF